MSKAEECLVKFIEINPYDTRKYLQLLSLKGFENISISKLYSIEEQYTIKSTLEKYDTSKATTLIQLKVLTGEAFQHLLKDYVSEYLELPGLLKNLAFIT